MRYLVGLFLVITTSGIANNIMFAPPVSGYATSASAKVLNQNTLRSYIIVVNKSATTTMYAKFGSSAQSSGEGVPIPAGGSYEPIMAPANALYLSTFVATSAPYVVVYGQ